MNKFNKYLILAACGVAMGLGAITAKAQGGPPQFNSDVHDLTPIYQKILENQRNLLVVTNDAEWNVISPKLQSVDQFILEAHTVNVRSVGVFSGGGGSLTTEAMRQMMVLRGRLPDVPHDAEDALQKALASHAPPDEIAAAVAKVRAARQQKQADMAKAQADLREVLTPTQAAILVSHDILD